MSLVIIILCLFIYFLPALIAYNSDKKQKVAILALNLLLGWTFIGWVGAFVWACIRD